MQPKNFVVAENPTDPSFYPRLEKFYVLYIGAKIFLVQSPSRDEFQLLPHHASCPDHLSTEITKHVSVK